MRSVLRTGALVLGALLLALQLVPYGRDHDNPPVVRDAPWPTPEGRRLAVAACYDCHSNETKWPLYSYVAPMSWLVQRDVENGRRELNFSTGDVDADDAADAVEDGSMPPRNYTLLHPDARLSAQEKAALIRELEAFEERDEDRSGSNRGRG
jgi:hypothetical protein